MGVEIQPYFAEGERYPALIGVRVEGDEYETAYVSKSELVDALAENAKLREEIEAAKHDLQVFSMGSTQLEAENAKLRELVRLLLWGVDNDMPRYEELAWTQKVNVLVRELGVEVDA